MVPEDYKASFSALISLKCDPEVDKFLDYVTVAVPHCAHGDSECLCECLCVLSASECGDSKEPLYLQEDSDIDIVSIDEHYFTFKTKHFTRFKVAANTKNFRKQRQRKMYPKKARTFFKSLKRIINERFVAIRVFPEYETESPQKCLLVITYDASDTFVEVRSIKIHLNLHSHNVCYMGLLFGVNGTMLTQHISGLVTKYKLLYVSNQGRTGARALVLRVRVGLGLDIVIC